MSEYTKIRFRWCNYDFEETYKTEVVIRIFDEIQKNFSRLDTKEFQYITSDSKLYTKNQHYFRMDNGEIHASDFEDFMSAFTFNEGDKEFINITNFVGKLLYIFKSKLPYNELMAN